MKKIIYSLLICFLLLFTIPSVHAANETVYVDGKELIVTDTKAYVYIRFQPTEVIPDGKGYFIELSTFVYGYVTNDKTYAILKSNDCLPLDLFNLDLNLFPTLFNEVYVYNGYWAIPSDKPKIVGEIIYSTNSNNLFTLDFELDEFICDFSFLNNTYGFFYKKDNYFYYRFYYLISYDNDLIIDFSKNYICRFALDYAFLPNDLKFSIYDSNINEFKADEICYYTIYNNKWNINFDLKNLEYSFDSFKLFYSVEIASNYHNKNIVVYFNIYEDFSFSSLLNIDYMEFMSLHIEYSHNSYLDGQNFIFDITIEADDKVGIKFPKYYAMYNYNNIIDCHLSNKDYFIKSDTYYRFCAYISLDEYTDKPFDYFLNIDGVKDLKITHASYSYMGVIYYNQDPPQIVIKDNCSNINFFTILKYIILCSMIIFLILIIFKVINYFTKKNKK